MRSDRGLIMWLQRIGSIFLRIAMPAWTLLGGSAVLIYGLAVLSRGSDDGWPFIVGGSAIIAVSIWMFWFHNNRRARKRDQWFVIPDEDDDEDEPPR